MIRLNNVTKRFNLLPAVNDISMEIAEGETMVLLGTSGCGKTTTLRMINRLEESSTGEIFVNGKNIKQQQPEVLRRNIGYVLQHHGLFPHYTVAENISVVPTLLKWDRQKIQSRTEELMHKLQLSETLANQYPHQLSGGQQQRVGLARALAADPPVLLMDEPFGALDPITRTSIRKEFKNLDELKNKTIIMVTHDVEEAFEVGDKICLMNNGKIVQAGAPSALLFQPVNEFVSSFLSEKHFKLALENISLSDVWEFLPKAIERTNDNTINSETTLWKFLQDSSLSNKGVNYVTTHNNDTRQVDAAGVIAAYSLYQKNSQHG